MFRAKNGDELNLSWLESTHLNGLSADGSAALISEIGQGGGPFGSVYLRRTNGSPAMKLGSGVGLALSPDAKWALTRPTDKPEFALVWTAAGPTYTLQLPRAVSIHASRWFPDGDHIALSLENEQWIGCYVQDLDAGRPRGSPYPIANLNMVCRAVSVDGQYVMAQKGTEPHGFTALTTAKLYRFQEQSPETGRSHSVQMAGLSTLRVRRVRREQLYFELKSAQDEDNVARRLNSRTHRECLQLMIFSSRRMDNSSLTVFIAS